MPRKKRDHFGIDVEAVYDTITNNLPAFKKGISRALRGERAAARAAT